MMDYPYELDVKKRRRSLAFTLGDLFLDSWEENKAILAHCLDELAHSWNSGSNQGAL